MTAQIHAFPALKSQAELDFETIHGDYADDIVLAACARLKHHRNWIYSDRARRLKLRSSQTHSPAAQGLACATSPSPLASR